jgi:hypothetical protein
MKMKNWFPPEKEDFSAFISRSLKLVAQRVAAAGGGSRKKNSIKN